MPTQIQYPHISTRADGTPILAPSGFKVRMLVQAYLAAGMNASALHELYPDLTKGQIHSALAYYWDHQAEMDAAIAESEAIAKEYMVRFPSQLSRAELEKRRNH